MRERARNAARAGRYDTEHKREAQQVRDSVLYGVTVCWRCNQTIDAPPVDADHTPMGLVPTHASCNRGKRLPK